MRVLITGGTGFIGSRLALALLEDGESVRVLGLAGNPIERANATEIERRGGSLCLGSLVDPDLARQAVQGIEVVVHLAAAQHEANVPDRHFWDVNVTGTQNLLEAAAAAGVRRFVHGSTIGVFGGRAGAAVSEESPLEPTNIYGVTKRKAEEVVAAFRERGERHERHERLETVTIRISETYGPGDHRLLKLFRTVRKGRFFYVGACTNLHHPIYIDDLITGLRLASSSGRAAGETFVLAGPSPVTTRAMVETIARVLGVPPPRLRLPFGPFWLAALGMETILRPAGIQPPLHRRRLNFFRLSFSFSGEKPRRELGFVPEIALEEGIGRTARWYRDSGLL